MRGAPTTTIRWARTAPIPCRTSAKAYPPAREALAWYCRGCGALVHARALDPGVVQGEHWHAVEVLNGDAALRTCGGCQQVHPPVDLGDIAWRDVAAALRAEEQA